MGNPSAHPLFPPYQGQESQVSSCVLGSSTQSRPKCTQQATVDFGAIQRSREVRIQQIMSSNPDIAEPTRTEYGCIFDQLLGQASDDNTFHLGIENLIEIGNALSEVIRGPPRRGQREQLSPHDELFVYCTWLSTTAHQKQLEANLGISPTLFSRTLERIRTPLNQYLTSKFSNPPRPEIHPDCDFPEVALLVDATTVTIPTPALIFAERKVYYDGHHQCYSMKIEVAVNPHPPHQALFISNVVPGSVHDVTLFRQNIERYRVYLRKTTLEMQILPQDTAGSLLS